MVSYHPSENELRSAYAFVKNQPFPSIPDVVHQVNELLDQREPHLPHLIKLISEDISLVGIVLKTINSAGFGYGAIESIQHAVTLLGIDRIRSVLNASYVERFLPIGSLYAQQLVDDSKLTARAARVIASELGVSDPDEAYIAGLMLDSGAIFLSSRFSDQYQSIFDMRFERPVTINRIEDVRIGTNHSTIGYLFARHWQLPEIVCLTIYLHHGTMCTRVQDEKLRSLLAVLKLAEHLAARETGATMDPSMEKIQQLAGIKNELMLDQERMTDMEQLLS